MESKSLKPVELKKRQNTIMEANRKNLDTLDSVQTSLLEDSTKEGIPFSSRGSTKPPIRLRGIRNSIKAKQQKLARRKNRTHKK